MSMPEVETSESELPERLTAILRSTPPLMRVLQVARHLCLPDWLVFSGAVYQPVLNQLTDRPLEHGNQRLRPRLFRCVQFLLRGRGCGDPTSKDRFRRAAAKHG